MSELSDGPAITDAESWEDERIRALLDSDRAHFAAFVGDDRQHPDDLLWAAGRVARVDRWIRQLPAVPTAERELREFCTIIWGECS